MSMRTSIIIDADASGVERARRQGEAALNALGLKTGELSRTFKSAEQSASVFTGELQDNKRAVDQLTASYNPQFAALQRLNQAQTLVRRAAELGNITKTREIQLNNALQAEYRQSIALIDQAAAAQRRWTTVTAGGAGGMQNFAFQLQDIFTQVGMGVPLMISLGQQAPQILSGFGTVGAVLGVVAAGVLPLTAAILGLSYGSKSAGDDIASMADLTEDALSRISDAQATLRENSITNLDGIIEKYGEVTAEVLALLTAQNEVAVYQAMQATRAAVSGFAADDERPDFRRLLADTRLARQDAEREIIALTATLDTSLVRGQLEAQIDQIQRDLDADRTAGIEIRPGVFIDDQTVQDLARYEEALNSALDANNFAGVETAANKLLATLMTLPSDVLPQMRAHIVDVLDAILQSGAQADVLADVTADIAKLMAQAGTTDISSNIAAGVAQATALADELGRALANAQSLAASSVSDLDTARVNFQFRDDPIGRAAALAELQFDAQTTPDITLPDGATAYLERDLEAARQQFIDNKVAVERYNQALEAYREEQAEAGRAGGSSIKEAESERKRLIDGVRRDVRGLRSVYADDVAALEQWKTDALAALNPLAKGYEQFAADVDLIFADKMRAAYLEDLQNRDDWAAGVGRAFASLEDDMISWADFSEGLFTQFAQAGEDAFVSLSMTGKATVGDMVDVILEQMLRLSYQHAIAPAVNGLFNMALGSIGGASAPVTVGQSHAGSTLSGGGVQRTYSDTAPLRRDERITITKAGQKVFTPEQIANGSTVVEALAAAAAASQQTGAVFAPNIQVVNQSSAPVTGQMHEVSDGAGGRHYQMVLADRVGTALSQPGGGAKRTLRDTYGVRPKGTLR